MSEWKRLLHERTLPATSRSLALDGGVFSPCGILMRSGALIGSAQPLTRLLLAPGPRVSSACVAVAFIALATIVVGATVVVLVVVASVPEKTSLCLSEAALCQRREEKDYTELGEGHTGCCSGTNRRCCCWSRLAYCSGYPTRSTVTVIYR